MFKNYGPSFRHTPVQEGPQLMYKNDTGKAIYADAQGNVVDEGDPNAATLVVGPNGSLSAKEASRYGLTNEPKQAEAPVENAKAVEKPAANKAITNKETK